MFLTPIAAIVAGVLTLPVLLTLYFLKLRRRPVRVSSTMFWASSSTDTQVNTPFRMIRPSWLLFLHLLILALLLLAIARPTLPGPGTSDDRIILLIDRSASMAAQTPSGQSHLDLAKQRAKRILNAINRDSSSHQIAVISFAHSPRIIVPFTHDQRAVLNAIEKLTPLDQPDRLQNALDAAASLVTRDGDESTQSPPTRVILITDGVIKSAPTSTTYTLAGAKLTYERVTPLDSPAQENLSIVSMSVQRDPESPKTIRGLLRVLSTNPNTKAATIQITQNNQITKRIAATFTPQLDAIDSPAQAVVPFTLTSSAQSLITASLTATDALASDNTARITLDAATRPSVLLVSSSAFSTDATTTTDLTWILGDQLSAMNLSRLENISPTTYAQLHASGQLKNFDLVIFDVAPTTNPSFLPTPPIPSLSFGMSPALPGLSVEPAQSAKPTTLFISWERTHPALRHVALDQTLVPANQHIIIKPDSPATELARGVPGVLIAQTFLNRNRHILCAFALRNSTWPLQVGFTIFLANAVDLLADQNASASARFYTTIDPVMVTPKPQARQISLSGPINRTINLAQNPAQTSNPISLSILPRQGVYRVQGAEPQMIAVNLFSPSESLLASRSSISIAGIQISARQNAQLRHEIWHWFVGAAALLLAIEWFLYAWRIRI